MATLARVAFLCSQSIFILRKALHKQSQGFQSNSESLAAKLARPARKLASRAKKVAGLAGFAEMGVKS